MSRSWVDIGRHEDLGIAGAIWILVRSLTYPVERVWPGTESGHRMYQEAWSEDRRSEEALMHNLRGPIYRAFGQNE